MKFWQAMLVSAGMILTFLALTFGFYWAYYNVSRDGAIVAGVIFLLLLMSWGMWEPKQ